MKKMEISQMEDLLGGNRPCIGTGHVTVTAPNGCYQNCLQDYFLWIAVGGTYGCGESICPGQF